MDTESVISLESAAIHKAYNGFYNMHNRFVKSYMILEVQLLHKIFCKICKHLIVINYSKCILDYSVRNRRLKYHISLHLFKSFILQVSALKRNGMLA